MATSSAPDSDNEAQDSLREVPSITLIDATKSAENPTELASAPTGITKTLTHNSIRQKLARRRYQRSKWQEGRGSQSGIATPGLQTPPPDLVETVHEEGHGDPSTPATRNTTLESQDAASVDQDTWGQGRFRRGGQRVKDVIRSRNEQAPRTKGQDPDSRVDILYENQRGFFFAGIPHFSSNSLLNFDPTAWLDARFRPSAVNITNAQVPDPSWDWAWRCWYVDMSGDVDEEGWEYSFWFGKSAAWHGTHPWFHSFVRRRRWLRKRTKRKSMKVKEDGHALSSDYFTIHTKVRPAGEPDGDSVTTSEKKAQYSMQTSTAWGAKSWEDQTDVAEITNVPDLMRGLKAAAVDREKIVLVGRFLTQGGDELHYLAENMEHIMKLLIFQNSRRQLLSTLMHEFEAAEKHQEEQNDRNEKESGNEKRRVENLHKAVEAADEQCKQLEYWSDVRDMARDGDLLHASEKDHGWDHGWQGLDASGPDSPGRNPSDSDEDDGFVAERPSMDKGKRPAQETDEVDVPGGWIDGTIETSRKSEESGRNDKFFSPDEEKTQAHAMQRTPTAKDDIISPSAESELSLDVYESAHSEPEEEEDDDDDDTVTERALSEDERDIDIDDAPPTGTIPVTAINKMLNGGSKEGEDKGTASQ